MFTIFNTNPANEDESFHAMELFLLQHKINNKPNEPNVFYI